MRMKCLMLAGLCVLLLGAGEARAQRGLPGQLGIGLSTGTLDGLLLRDSRLCYRYWAGLELARYNRNHSYWNFGFGYLHKDYAYDGVTGRQRVPVAQYTAEAGYNLPLAADRGRNVILYGGLSALLGYETSGRDGKTLEDGATLVSGDGFLYGAALGATFEGYLSDRVILLLRVRQRCAFGSPTGIFHTELGFGLRFIIN